ncbi:phosphopentomutase [Patescibacteria group bacterium]|nr:phosphopentomutase [Patescibacteria group bacterium]MBU1870855.1 phosphopentomutase [Patescibacteria group bacterium]
MKFNRIIILILDSVGCGVQPDYKKYHHENCNTLGNIYKNRNNFHLPNLERIGLNKVLFDVQNNNSIAGKMMEKSKGNDTFVGVCEMMGVILNKRFRKNENGFPQKIINKINSDLDINIVGNEYISGFKALDKYYNEHVKKVSPILYLADDGVVLLAAHENIIKPNRLNQMGKQTAEILKSQNISRVISRPFIGFPFNFTRTGNRKDFLAVNLFRRNSILNNIKQNNIKFLTTEHLYNLLGNFPCIDYVKGSFNNNDLIKIIIKSLQEYNKKSVFLFCLQDFDMFGHKKDTAGYAKKLIEFDNKLPSIIKFLAKEDLLVITADHGCDPTTSLRGHTREFVPIILYSKSLNTGKDLGTRSTFADVGQTICSNFNLPKLKNGVSLLSE